jgi:hypothetical protein
MLDGKVPEREILNVTGQHAIATINHYDHQKMKRKVEISDVINNILPENNFPPILSATVTSGEYERNASQVEAMSITYQNVVTLGKLKFYGLIKIQVFHLE